MDLQSAKEQTSSSVGNHCDPGDVRELELELMRIRAEARAARLEARAAEIELMLRRSARGKVSAPPETPSAIATVERPQMVEPMGRNPPLEVDTRGEVFPDYSAPPNFADPPNLADPVSANAGCGNLLDTQPAATASRIMSWDELLRAAQVLTEADIGRPHVGSAGGIAEVTREAETGGVQEVTDSEASGGSRLAEADGKTLRMDSPPAGIELSENFTTVDTSTTANMFGALKPCSVPRPKLLDFVEAIGESSKRELPQESLEAVAVLEKSADDARDENQGTQRRRPTPWLLSILAHAVVLILLAGVTLSVREPQDQIALSASAAQPSDEQVETMVLEQTEQPETNNDSQAETITTVNPLGDIAAAVVDVTGPGIPDVVATPGDSLSQMLGQSISAGGSPGDVSATFFGASGGGNHFVYLVDSSRSMDDVSRDGFDVARAEVLRAVETLNEKQRFYVIFFGEETMRMRLGNASGPEPRSVYATDENKLALRRWAATISMQPGRWPEDGLEFAFTLRPDCIFLLTDGAMPEYVPEMIGRNNIVETLLDGPKPRSIIHTIGFHNPTGEAILSKIAKENSGTYHFVPANANSRR